MAILETRGLRKIYNPGGKANEVRALNGVDITVEKGEFVSIVGTSGSGKSTLLHMLGGLDRPTEGSVTVDGHDIFKLKDEALTIFRRRKIGFVFQAYNLVPVLNFINVTITSINARRNVLAVMQAVGMTDKQLKRMLIKESLQKILLTFAFVITIGSLLTFAIVKLITMEMWMFSYHFTIWPVFASVPIFLLVAVIVPAVLHNIMRKESLVERLREE